MHGSMKLTTGKTCSNGWCKASFEVMEDDLAFYDKASPIYQGKKELIPPPTLCPECRNRRRMAWRNERNLYARSCELCKKPKVSVFPTDSSMHTYCRDCLYSDGWDPMVYGKQYDFSRDFHANFLGLLRETPVMMLFQSGINENCDYINFAGTECRNCYLIFNSGRDEDCYYSRGLIESKDCMDMLICSGDQLCYECVNCSESYRLLFSQNSAQCQDSAFLFNCRRCRHCFGCTNLVQKEYYLFNKPCTPEEYQTAMVQLNSSACIARSAEQLQEARLSCIHRATNNIQAEDCTGDYLFSCKNCKDSHEAKGAEDCKWLMCAKLCKDSYDLFGFAYDSELLYENVGVGMSVSAGFSFSSSAIVNSYFCFYCENVQNCFACVSLHHKKYCILNMQYSQEEYEALVPKIIAAMRKNGQWGEYLPASESTFRYNETVAQEYLPLSEEEVRKRGWRWKADDAAAPPATRIIPAAQLPDGIDAIPDDILNWAILCEATGKPFKVIKQELDFYRKMRLPVPHLHPDERHRRRMALKNPMKLWRRECGKCGKAMETTYSPDRKEIVYCERCYLEAVY